MSQNEEENQSRKEPQAMNRNVPWKDILLIIAIIYFLSPIDFVPGVLADDIAALGAALIPVLKRALWL